MANADELRPPNPKPVESEGGLRAPPGLSTWGKVWWWFHLLILVKLARLRFVAVLAAIGAVILYWDTLVAFYEKWTRPAAAAERLASEYEFFCPMHPQVVTDDPKAKCPICFMNLSRRPKGEAAAPEALPPGVVTRLQLSPYRVVTAGIQTSEVSYQTLAKRIETVGTVEFDERKLRRISANVKGRIDQLFVNVTGQMVHPGQELASLYSPELVTTVQNLLDAQRADNRELAQLAADRLRLWGVTDDQIDDMRRTGRRITHVTVRAPVGGHVVRKFPVEGQWVEEAAPLYDVADLSTVWIMAQVYESDVSFLREGLSARAATEGLPGKPFKGKVAFVDPHLDQATRTLRVRFDIDNPEHRLKPEASLRPGMWATVTVEVPAGQLSSRFLAQNGAVLAVPDSAVIETGNQKLVYRQEAPTVFDAVPLELGPPLTGSDDGRWFPVVSGLAAGDRVVTTGSYLLDAETRVSAAAGSIYYGGAGAAPGTNRATVSTVRPTTPQDEEAQARANLAKLSTPDRRLAEAQKFCPVRGTRLGSMGVPIEILLEGQPIFLCCAGCEAEARSDPAKTLHAVQELKRGRAALPRSTAEREAARVRKNLAKLSAEDRRLAESQKFCPILTENRLGSMGVPVKVVVQDQPVFLCCSGCKRRALANPGQTLTRVREFRGQP